MCPAHTMNDCKAQRREKVNDRLLTADHTTKGVQVFAINTRNAGVTSKTVKLIK